MRGEGGRYFSRSWVQGRDVFEVLAAVLFSRSRSRLAGYLVCSRHGPDCTSNRPSPQSSASPFCARSHSTARESHCPLHLVPAPPPSWLRGVVRTCWRWCSRCCCFLLVLLLPLLLPFLPFCFPSSCPPRSRLNPHPIPANETLPWTLPLLPSFPSRCPSLTPPLRPHPTPHPFSHRSTQRTLTPSKPTS